MNKGTAAIFAIAFAALAGGGGGFLLAKRPAWPNYSAIFETRAASVVGIRGADAVGTGFAISASRVVTVRHLVVGQEEVTAHTFDGRVVELRVVGTDARSDLALLESSEPLFEPAVLGDSNPLVGESVVALGHPFGLGHSLAAGTVAGANRRMASSDTEFLQLSIGLNPGNSGGPLFNEQGGVVGVLTGLHTQGQAIAFAVPVEELRRGLPALEQGAKVSRAFLGVRTEASGEALEVVSVVSASPADQAGIRVGDRLLSFAGEKVKEVDDLGRWLDRKAGGDKVVVELSRESARLSVGVTLADWAEHPVVTGGMTLAASPGSGGEILAVRPGSRAEKAGIKRGDRLRAIDGRPVLSPADVQERLAGGGARSVDLWREGVVLTVQLPAPG